MGPNTPKTKKGTEVEDRAATRNEASLEDIRLCLVDGPNFYLEHVIKRKIKDHEFEVISSFILSLALVRFQLIMPASDFTRIYY